FDSPHTYLFYSNKTLADAVKKKELQEHLGSRYYEAITQETTKGSHIISGRLTAEGILTKLPKGFSKQAHYFICGPKPFYQAIAQGLKSKGVDNEKIHFEEFSL